MSSEFLRAAITIAFGALAGGLTNTVAVWMLFHPYEPIRLRGRRLPMLHGAIPKNQDRLAAAIGRTVGDRLLTEEDLARTFASPSFREAFDERLSRVVRSLLEEERGTLRDLLPSGVTQEVEETLQALTETGLQRLRLYLESDAFEEAVRARIRELAQSLEDEPVGAFLTPAREEFLTQAVDEWIESTVEGDRFQSAVEDSLHRASRRLLQPGRTFEEVLPPGLVSSVERAVAGYLPLAIERLGRLLDDPAARLRFEGAIHDLLQRFLRDLRFHQRVVARLIVTEETVDRVLDTIEEEGAEHLSEMLRDPAVQEAMGKGVNDAVVDFLRRPVTSVLGEPDDPNIQAVRETVAGWVLTGAREPSTRTFLLEKLRGALDRTSARTWGELFQRVPPDQVADWAVQVARSDAAGRLYREAATHVATSLLDHPLGRPSDWLPQGAPQRLEEALADPLWEWLQSQIPDVVRRVDVASRVETKVRDYPTRQLEELVRRVTHRELRLIVRLGYLLGALIGGVLVGVNLLV